MVKNRTWWAEDYERDDDEEEEPDLDVEVDKSNIDITQRDAETNAKQQRLHPTLPPNTSAALHDCVILLLRSSNALACPAALKKHARSAYNEEKRYSDAAMLSTEVWRCSGATLRFFPFSLPFYSRTDLEMFH
eukprot:764692-Rhodomonas_salina.4